MDNSNDKVMHIRMMLIKMTDDLKHIAESESPLLFLDMVDKIRREASASGSAAVAALMSKLETALETAQNAADAKCQIDRHLEWVDTAIGCAANDLAARDALMAAIAVRNSGV